MESPTLSGPSSRSASLDSSDDPDSYSEDTDWRFPNPFLSRNPQGNLCPTLPSTSSVEKHLFDCQRQPPFCPVCRVIFTSHAESKVHIVARSCKQTEYPVIEGLTEMQSRQIGRCLVRSWSEPKKYHKIWDVVHPGEVPAQSCCHDSSTGERHRDCRSTDEETRRIMGPSTGGASLVQVGPPEAL